MKKIQLKKLIPLICLLSLLIFGLTSTALAQANNQLTLRMSRDFGYAGGGQIQGLWSIQATGPTNLVRVVFKLDGQTVIGEDTIAPFKVQFSTDNYPLGKHTLSATGYTSDGQEIISNVLSYEFVSANEGTKAAGKILIPVGILVLVAFLASTVLPAVLGRNKQKKIPLGARRNYGISGGTICRKCHRPYSMHFFTPNLLFGKLDRCPYCGTFALVRPMPLDLLRQAEADELKDAQSGEQIPEESEEEKLRKELEESKYRGV